MGTVANVKRGRKAVVIVVGWVTMIWALLKGAVHLWRDRKEYRELVVEFIHDLMEVVDVVGGLLGSVGNALAGRDDAEAKQLGEDMLVASQCSRGVRDVGNAGAGCIAQASELCLSRLDELMADGRVGSVKDGGGWWARRYENGIPRAEGSAGGSGGE